MELKRTQGLCDSLENPVISCFCGCPSLDSGSGTEGKQFSSLDAVLLELLHWFAPTQDYLVVCWSHCHHLKVQIFPCRAAGGVFQIATVKTEVLQYLACLQQSVGFGDEWWSGSMEK